jgi:2-C-methyl-D-erythritol 4-phosphate cytidylyltransferase
MKAVALVVAGGRGARLGGAIPKQFLRLGKLPLLVYALRTFQRSRQIVEMVLVTPQGFASRATQMVRSYSLSKVRRVVVGGKERQDSVLLGLRAVPEDTDFVLIHDAARPGVTPRLVEGSIRLAKAKKAGVLVAIPVTDTLKRVEGMEVFATLDRAVLWRAQTPQVFPYPAVLEACERAARQGFRATDDSAVFQWAGGRVHVLRGEETNLKVTTRQDLAIAQRLLCMKTKRE